MIAKKSTPKGKVVIPAVKKEKFSPEELISDLTVRVEDLEKRMAELEREK